MLTQKTLKTILVSVTLLISLNQYAAQAETRVLISQNPPHQVRPITPERAPASLMQNSRTQQLDRGQSDLIELPQVEPVIPSVSPSPLLENPTDGMQIPICRILPWCHEVDPNSQRVIDLQSNPAPGEPEEFREQVRFHRIP